MKYKLQKSKSNDTQQVQLIGSEWGRFIRAILLGLFGLPLSLFSFLVIIPTPQSTIIGITGGMGLMMLGGSLHMLFSKSKPIKLIFDNQKAALLIQESRFTWSTPSLPYSEIKGFGTSGYNIYLEKHDGSRWVLWSESSKQETQASLSYLEQHVLLNKGQWKEPFAPELSTAISVTTDKEGTTLRWRSGGHVLARIGQLFLLLSFAVVVQGALASQFATPGQDMGTVESAKLFVFGGIFFGVALVGLVYTIGTLWSWTTVHIDSERLTVKQGRFRLPGIHYSMPSQAIASIVLDWNPTLYHVGNKPIVDSLMVQTAKEYEQQRESNDLERDLNNLKGQALQERIDEEIEAIEAELEEEEEGGLVVGVSTPLLEDVESLGELSDAVDEVALSMGMKRINVDDLSLSDRVALEYKMQALLEEYTGHRPA